MTPERKLPPTAEAQLARPRRARCAAASERLARGESLLFGEEGMVSWATLIAVVFFLVLASLVSNTGIVAFEKIESQNAADAVAYSGSTWMARGMNSVTAANHMMGELTALYVLHHALGGKWLDENPDDTDGNQTSEIRWTNLALQGSYRFASNAWYIISVPGWVFDTVHDDDPRADRESTIYEAKLRLKRLLTAAYGLHGSGGIIARIPWLSGVGMAMQGAALVAELKIGQEYKTLNLVEQLAAALVPVKRDAIPAALRLLSAYGAAVRTTAPLMAQHAASAIGKEHDATGLMAPLELPLVKDPTKVEERSQLIRATYPWVHAWRAPALRVFAAACTLSGAEGFYEKWTNAYSLRICRQFRLETSQSTKDGKGKGLVLYVIEDLDAPRVDKGQEPWTRQAGSRRAEELFCHIGLSRRESPRIWARPFFRQGNPDGMVALSQTMIYNANPQQAGARRRSMQPVAGWDTLNWEGEAVEWKQSGSHSPPMPKVKLNWQARLSPVTPTKFSWLQWQSLSDERIERVVGERLSPTRALGKWLFTH